MPENSSSVTESLKAGNRVVAFGIAAIVLILLAAALFLFLNLPDANAFNARVERLFVENNNLNTGAEIKLLEILAQSGTAFSSVLTSYRSVIFVLLLFSTALLVAALVFLVMIIALNRRISAIQRSGIQVASAPQWSTDGTPTTAIHRFDLATLEHTGSGSVPGELLNDFSMSEQGDHLPVFDRQRDPMHRQDDLLVDDFDVADLQDGGGWGHGVLLGWSEWMMGRVGQTMAASTGAEASAATRRACRRLKASMSR